MKTAKLLLIILLISSFTQVFGQPERSSKETAVSVKSSTPKQIQGATFGERKGWDGSVKGNKIQVVPTEDGIIIIFPNDLAYKIDETNGSVAETRANTSSQSRVAGNPISGLSVKGGKNPGGQMRGIDKKDIRFYELPTDWTDGSYTLQVSYDSQSDETATLIGDTPQNNARGKIKGKVSRPGGNFILEKQGASYAVSSVSSLSGAGGGAAAASYARP